MAQDIISDGVHTMIPSIYRLVYIVPIFVLIPYIITQFFHDVIGTFCNKQLIFLDFVYTSNHGARIFIYRVYVHTTVPYVREDIHPELGSFVVADVEAEDLLPPLHIDAQGDVEGLVDALATLPAVHKVMRREHPPAQLGIGFPQVPFFHKSPSSGIRLTPPARSPPYAEALLLLLEDSSVRPFTASPAATMASADFSQFVVTTLS